MSQQAEVIETTVSEVASELSRRGLDPHDRVTITIQPDELIPGRREARLRVIAAGLSDDDIDRLIEQAQQEVEPGVGSGVTTFGLQSINSRETWVPERTDGANDER